MSSTVTTTTVTLLTSAVNVEELMASLTLVVIALLGFLLLSKEVTHSSVNVRVRRFTRGLDIAMVPLLISFAMTIALRNGLGG